ncbi:MAG: hypothetical protein WD696_18125 [Bryobacteraceae bacterium]
MVVLIDGQNVLSWSQPEGDVTKDVPPEHANKSKIHIRGEGTPNGRNAQMQVFFDNALKKNMEFDNGEDHDLEK